MAFSNVIWRYFAFVYMCRIRLLQCLYAMLTLCLCVLCYVYVILGSASWGSWSSWTKSCPRLCADTFGIQHRRRSCLICNDRYDCTPVRYPTAISHCLGPLEERRKCYKADECEGDGPFTGEWSTWKAFGPCMTTSVGCNIPGLQYYSRSCQASRKGFRKFGIQCPVTNQTLTFRYRDCVKECPSNKRREVRSFISVWSNWSNWQCVANCTSSEIPAIRTRICQGELCYRGIDKLLDYDNRSCIGPNGPLCRFESKHYPTSLIPPRARRVKRRDGKWSDWSGWACSVTCGSGIRYRYRYCHNPRPTGNGKKCEGPNHDEDGKSCNTIACPQDGKENELPQDIRDVVYRVIGERQVSFVTRENKYQSFMSRSEAFYDLYHRYPVFSLQWTHNGMPLVNERGVSSVKFDTYYIYRVKYKHNGVYTATFYWRPRHRVTYYVAALVVLSSHVFKTHAGDNVELPCNGGTLGILFKGVRQIWFLNGKIYKDYGSTPPQSVNMEYIRNITPGHAGLWECMIKDDAKNRAWMTNRINVTVIVSDPPALKFYESLFPDPIHFYGVVTIGAVAIVAICICCVYQSRKTDVLAEEEAEIFQGLLSEASSLRGSNNSDDITSDSHSDGSVEESDSHRLLKDGGTIHKDSIPVTKV